MNGEGISVVGPSFPFSYIGGFTAGSVPFANTNGFLTELNNVMFFDPVNNKLVLRNPVAYTTSLEIINQGGEITRFDGANITSPGEIVLALTTLYFRCLARFERSIRFAYIANLVSGNTLSNMDHIAFITTGAGAFTLNLPTAVGIGGREYRIKKVDAGAGACTITPAGAETIDGAANYVLAAQWKYVTIISDGANWVITSNN